MSTQTILVVESDNDMRRRMAGWLEDEGYNDVMFCPGPGGPEYTCIGSGGAACPLSNAADVVVINLQLRSDEAMKGTPGWQLMLNYYEQGKKIVALNGHEDAVHPYSDEWVRVVSRPVDRAEFVAAVRAFSHPAYARAG